MRMHDFVTIIRHTSVAAFLMTCAWPAHAQTSGTFTAVAKVSSSAGAAVEAPLTVTVKRFATEDERTALVNAIRDGGTGSAQVLLTKQPDAGTLQLGGRTTSIKYAYVRPTADGRLITAITGEPIVFIGAGMPGAKETSGYMLGLVILEVPANGAGQGEMVPAARIRVDAQNAVVTEDYSAANVVQLTNVAAK
jgi:hypothetical protein